jgi:guanylate kinase
MAVLLQAGGNGRKEMRWMAGQATLEKTMAAAEDVGRPPDVDAPRGQERREVARRGLMLVLSSPSGAGKTTLSRLLLERDSTIDLSISVTTRKPRPGEINGRDYHFIDDDRFDAMAASGELLEWAQVFGNRYGTPRAPVARALAAGRDVLFDIDWQGTQQLRENGRHDLVSVFVLPPSIRDLEARLRNRAQDDEDVIRTRMSKAASEMSHWAEYDYVVINRDVWRAYEDVCAILAAERLKRKRQTGLSAFVRGLQADL